MGNTVSRSHIRDADRGVAKATRVNTKRNSSAFSVDPSLSASVSTAVALQPVPITAASLTALQLHPLPSSSSHPTLNSAYGPQHTRLPHRHDHTLAPAPPASSSPPPSPSPSPPLPSRDVDLIAAKAQSTPLLQPLSHQHQRHTSAPDSFEHTTPSLPNNPHSFTNASTHQGPPNPDLSYLAPDRVLPHHPHLTSPPPQNPNLPSQDPTSAPALVTPRRRERHPAANISFSRNSSSQSTTPNRPPLPPDLPPDQDRIEPLNDLNRKTSSARRSSPFSHRVPANIDPNLPGGTVRDCHTARTETPPRVDKPPRARKVVSFNENVHVVTYPNDASSTHSSLADDLPPRYPEGKQTRRRTRAVLRLLSRVAGPILQPEQTHYSEVMSAQTSCFSAQAEACCGLRLGGTTEVVYDELSPNGKLAHASSEKGHREGLAGGFDSSRELYNSSDLVVSYERARQTIDHLKADPTRPGVSVRKDTIADDFDYNERRHSDDDDTLSLSDAHPSRDGIDEPEAIGDQLLSPGKESKDDTPVNSAFNIVPLWQRLKRVDELDAMLPLSNAAREKAAQLSDTAGGSDKDFQDASDQMSETGGQAAKETDADTTGYSSNTQTGLSPPTREEHRVISGGFDGKPEATDRNVAVALTPVSEAGCDGDDVDGEQDIPAVATIMYASPSALDLGTASDPLSVADPASDVDALLAIQRSPEQRAPGSAPAEKSKERDCEPLQGAREINATVLLSAQNVTQGNVSDDHSVLSGGSLAEVEMSVSRSSESAIASGMEIRSFEPLEKPRKDDVEADGLDPSQQEKLKPVRNALSLLPGDGTSETSTFEESNVMHSEGDDSIQFNALSAATADDEGVRDGIVGLDLDPLCLPSHDDYSVAPCSPAQSPLAGVFYGTDSPVHDLNSPETDVKGVTGLADYPEYAMVKSQGNEDSVFGSEPNTPVLRTASGWNEPFNDFDLGDLMREEELPLRHGNFEDRKNRQAVPEVLLHDWSGSTPVEPNVEIVDSAPNSRSSSSYSHIFNPRLRDQQAEMPNAAVLLSTRLNVDMSKLYAASAGRSGSERLSYGQDRTANNAIPIVSGENRSAAFNDNGEQQSSEHSQQQLANPNEGRSSNSLVAWVSSDYEDHSQQNEDGNNGDTSDVASGAFFTSIPGLHPPDPKLPDFQISVDRKSFSDGYRRPVRINRGASFAETERRLESSAEPSSDFRNFSREHQKQEANQRRLISPQRRRRMSNLETSSNDQDDFSNNPFRSVIGRLTSGMNLAKRLVSSHQHG